MRILCVVFSPATGTLGSLTRILALAREFSIRGHEVLFCASGHVEALIKEKRFSTRSMPESSMFGLPRPLSRLLESRSAHFSLPVKSGKSVGSVWFVYYLTGMLNRRYLNRLVNAELKTIEEFKPDLIVTEMDPAAYLAARIADVPIVTTFAKISRAGKGSRLWRRARKVINSVLRAHGFYEPIEPDDLLAGTKTLGIIPSIQALDGSDENSNLVYVGNLLEPVHDVRPTFSAAKGGHYVFVYSGTGSLPLGRLRKVLPEAFGDLQNVVCLVAAESMQHEEKVGNVFFAPWIPAAEILPQCDLVICHGGLNTITQSIEAAVPLLCFPGAIFERRYNAEMLMKNGAGMMGEAEDFTPAWIRSWYDRRNEFSDGVNRLRADFAKYGGAKSAVTQILEWRSKMSAGTGDADVRAARP